MGIILGPDWSGWPTAARIVKISMYSYKWACRLGFYGISVGGLEIFWHINTSARLLLGFIPVAHELYLFFIHNYLDHTEAEPNNCFISQSK